MYFVFEVQASTVGEAGIHVTTSGYVDSSRVRPDYVLTDTLLFPNNANVEEWTLMAAEKHMARINELEAARVVAERVAHRLNLRSANGTL